MTRLCRSQIYFLIYQLIIVRYMSELVSESMLNDPVDRRPLMLSRVTPATLPKSVSISLNL